MKINLLAAGVFVAALAMPLGVCAQQNQAPGAYAGNRATPSQAKMQHRWAKRFGRLNLSGDQQQRIQSLINQYSQSHPEGSPLDPGAARDFRRQLMGVLTPDQQTQFRQEQRARRAQMQQRRGQMQQQPGADDQRDQQGYQGQQYQQGQPQGQQYQQGPPNQQYQQGPPGQQYQQGPPPDQRYQQGPPDQQYQQGPPPDQQDQQGPPAR
jgi:Spy/CpxP family protein refolding chaperone